MIDWLLNDNNRKKLMNRVNLITCPFTTGVHSSPVPRYLFTDYSDLNKISNYDDSNFKFIYPVIIEMAKNASQTIR
jgi:hypothetical protein